MTGQPALRADRLCWSPGPDTEPVLREVSLELWPGTTTLVRAEPGPARGALLGCLTGTLEPDSGTVSVGTAHLFPRQPGNRTAQQAISVTGRGARLLTQLTLTENVVLAQRANGRPDLPAPESTLDQVGLADLGTATPAELTAAALARATLAVALATAPAVLLADDPVTGLSTVEGSRLLRVMADAGPAVLIVSAADDATTAAAADQCYLLAPGRWARCAALPAPPARS